jgi:hypothetical protein
VPRKLSGSDSWKTSWLIITRSPTVIVPDGAASRVSEPVDVARKHEG